MSERMLLDTQTAAAASINHALIDAAAATWDEAGTRPVTVALDGPLSLLTCAALHRTAAGRTLRAVTAAADPHAAPVWLYRSACGEVPLTVALVTVAGVTAARHDWPARARTDLDTAARWATASTLAAACDPGTVIAVSALPTQRGWSSASTPDAATDHVLRRHRLTPLHPWRHAAVRDTLDRVSLVRSPEPLLRLAARILNLPEPVTTASWTGPLFDPGAQQVILDAAAADHRDLTGAVRWRDVAVAHWLNQARNLSPTPIPTPAAAPPHRAPADTVTFLTSDGLLDTTDALAQTAAPAD